jgi:uncharacterized protein
MPRFNINPKMYVIPNENNFILYSPLTGSVLEVTPGVVKEMQNISFGEKYNLDIGIKKTLREKGFISGKKFPKINGEVPLDEKYEPTAVTLMPTWDCNLRCLYCYSDGGINPGEILDRKVARASIDLIIANSLEKEMDHISVGFHGGGEPLIHKNMDWIKEITSYTREEADKNGLKSRVSSATNGFISKNNLEWVVNNFDRVNLSWDGTPEIQNLHRPGKNGLPTYETVLRTAKYLEEAGFQYGIRSTISDKSVDKMEEIVQLFVDETTVKGFHLEPLFECGRGENNPVLGAPSTEAFVENFIKAKKIAYANERTLYHSASDLEKVGRKFCGAAGSNFFVTPDGNVTSCLEVSRPDDDMNDIFMIGSFNNKQNVFEFDEERLETLRKRVVENVEGCDDCFAEYNCSGDCLAKAYAVSRDLFDSSNNVRCDANRALLLHEIKEKLK